MQEAAGCGGRNIWFSQESLPTPFGCSCYSRLHLGLFWGNYTVPLVRAEEHAHQSESQNEQEEDTVERVEGGEERRGR